MLKLIFNWLLMSIPSLIGVIVVTFVLTRILPGDPAVYFAGPAASQESIESTRKALGLDKSILEQFVVYITGLAKGDLGMSLSTGRPVLDELIVRLPASLELTFVGLLFTLCVAIPLGVVAAARPNSWIDHVSRIITTAGVSLPVFFTGLALVYVFYYLHNLAPSPMGRLSILLSAPEPITRFYLIDSLLAGDFEVFIASVKQIILPAFTLGIFALAPIARMTRASMLGVLSSDFIRAAKASGLSARVILYRYALKNALIPVLTTLGMVFSFLLGANVLVEKVYAWPGIGQYALEALVSSDYAPIQGFVLCMGTFYVSLNLVIDLLYSFIDPRVRLEA